LKIIRFENPSGKQVLRLTGTLHGKQIRKNFKTHKEASIERDLLDSKAKNAPELADTFGRRSPQSNTMTPMRPSGF